MILTATLVCFGGCASPIIERPAQTQPQPEMRAMGRPVAPPPPTLAPPPASASKTESTEEPTDETIGFQIRRLLNADPTTSAGITVEVDGGNVTLGGRAPTRAAAWRAEGAARALKGVKSVVNQIIVYTPDVTQ
jgi:hypothetical protein